MHGPGTGFAATEKSWVGPLGVVLPRKPPDRGVSALRKRSMRRDRPYYVGGAPNKIGWLTNPFYGTGSATHVVLTYRSWLLFGFLPKWSGMSEDMSMSLRALTLYSLPNLKWKKIYCDCPIGQPCHTDVWYELLYCLDCPF